MAFQDPPLFTEYSKVKLSVVFVASQWIDSVSPGTKDSPALG
jgi:hypothetical protein